MTSGAKLLAKELYDWRNVVNSEVYRREYNLDKIFQGIQAETLSIWNNKILLSICNLIYWLGFRVYTALTELLYPNDSLFCGLYFEPPSKSFKGVFAIICKTSWHHQSLFFSIFYLAFNTSIFCCSLLEIYRLHFIAIKKRRWIKNK